ncbi:TetR/AcrR family transcriptional regulator [Nocardioides sp. URHA0020]|uniref:TetR/AcrR family transcriptional regulator n=1 Tax=Nocardioides sp. URHA0020 TaxID=1380392 RepID=UPI000491E8F8|nr:TetR/AcrR family transcriptional regulator [Nocardioides sp. URHA0020]
MSPGTDPSRGRGRPRTPGADDKILAAALDEYAEHGWAGFTMDAVARRAGVGKSTVYLRWPDKDALLTDAVTNHGIGITTADTGTLAGDLRHLALSLLRQFHSTAGWAALRVTFDVASAHERLGAFSAAVIQVHGRPVEQICRRAVERGEMVEGVPTGAITEAIYGSAVVDALTDRLQGRGDDDAWIQTRADDIVAIVLRGIAGS